MKSLFSYVLAICFIFIVHSSKVHASGKEFIQNKPKILVASKYAERFCSAKADHFFKGLDNEKTLKYSYLKYIGLQNEEILSKEMSNMLINQIKEKCHINNKEEREINEFLIEAKESEKN